MRVYVFNNGNVTLRLINAKLYIEDTRNPLNPKTVFTHEWKLGDTVYPNEEKELELVLPPEVVQKVDLYRKYTNYRILICVNSLLLTKCRDI